MDTFLGIIALVGIVIVVVAVRRALRTPRAVPAPRQPSRPHPVGGVPPRPAGGVPPRMQQARRAPSEPSAGDEVSGWLIGHEVAHGHDGTPGDPLPGGHLGSAANLAFWGSAFDDEDEDD